MQKVFASLVAISLLSAPIAAEIMIVEAQRFATASFEYALFLYDLEADRYLGNGPLVPTRSLGSATVDLGAGGATCDVFAGGDFADVVERYQGTTGERFPEPVLSDSADNAGGDAMLVDGDFVYLVDAFFGGYQITRLDLSSGEKLHVEEEFNDPWDSASGSAQSLVPHPGTGELYLLVEFFSGGNDDAGVFRLNDNLGIDAVLINDVPQANAMTIAPDGRILIHETQLDPVGGTFLGYRVLEYESDGDFIGVLLDDVFFNDRMVVDSQGHLWLSAGADLEAYDSTTGMMVDSINPPAGFSGLSQAFVLRECEPSDTLLTLLDGRFTVEVDWESPGGRMDKAHWLPTAADAQSGEATFRNSDNIEFLVKFVDACGQANPAFWFFAAATTNVEYTLTVTDTVADQTETYFNQQGNASPAIIDTTSFTACP